MDIDLKMIKVLLYSLMLFVFIAGCGPQFYLPANQGKPAQIVVSAYTQNGCLEELQQEAKNRGVEVKLTNVETNFRRGPNPWEILFPPFYKGYKCTTGPDSPRVRPPLVALSILICPLVYKNGHLTESGAPASDKKLTLGNGLGFALQPR